MTPDDVPSPVDFQNMADAKAWERNAMQRPFREEFFAAFTTELVIPGKQNLRVLELGSGPGFLAHHILSRLQNIDYTLLDFSRAMHELAMQRLKAVSGNELHYLERNFKVENWTGKLKHVDVVVTNQAVHELRHKRHAPEFFRQVYELLEADGVFLFCDHFCGEAGMSNDQLYMTRDEQRLALEHAGFKVTEILVKAGRALYRAIPDKA